MDGFRHITLSTTQNKNGLILTYVMIGRHPRRHVLARGNGWTDPEEGFLTPAALLDAAVETVRAQLRA